MWERWKEKPGPEKRGAVSRKGVRLRGFMKVMDVDGRERLRLGGDKRFGREEVLVERERTEGRWASYGRVGVMLLKTNALFLLFTLKGA